MIEIMQYQTWKQRTYDRFRERSPLLLELDQAIAAYHEEKGVIMTKNPLHQDNKPSGRRTPCTQVSVQRLLHAIPSRLLSRIGRKARAPA